MTVDRCRSCGATIVWLVTASMRRMPVDTVLVMGQVLIARDDAERPRSHFGTCPDAAAWRARKAAK